MTQAVENKTMPEAILTISLPPAAPVVSDPIVAVFGECGVLTNYRRPDYRYQFGFCTFDYQITRKDKPVVLLDVHNNDLRKEEVETRLARATELGEIYIFCPRSVHGNTPARIIQMVEEAEKAIQAKAKQPKQAKGDK